MNKPKISLIVVYNNKETVIKASIESLLNQTFKDYELICVNNASGDTSEKIVIELTKNIEFVKRISLPCKIAPDEAQNSALMLSEGEFICFPEAGKIYDENFLSGIFAEFFSIKNIAKNSLHDKIYRREFIENSDIINNIIENKLDIKVSELQSLINEYEDFIKSAFDKSEKNNIENVNNKIYEVSCRFNQLEKNCYNIQSDCTKQAEGIIYKLKSERENITAQVYSDISKVYEFIKAEIDKKGCEINNVYEEITKNYRYSEDIVKQAKDEFSNNLYTEVNLLKEKLSVIEKDLVLRYVNLKRLFDLQIDDIDSKLRTIGVLDVSASKLDLNSVEVSKVLDENIEKIYSHINKTNSQFYEELSNLYKEMNDKLIEKMSEQQYSFDKKINDLRAEFNRQIETLKGN